MATVKIKDLPEITTALSADAVLVETSEGTKKMTAGNAAKVFGAAANITDASGIVSGTTSRDAYMAAIAGKVAEVLPAVGVAGSWEKSRNAAPRNKNITTEWYAGKGAGTLRGKIAAGDWSGVIPGDYIIGNVTGTKYVVVDLNYWKNKGDSTSNNAGSINHLTIMPAKLAGNANSLLWNGNYYAGTTSKITEQGRAPWACSETTSPAGTDKTGKNDTTGGYANSYIKTVILARVYTDWLVADFGADAVLKFRNWLSNAINADAASRAYTAWKGAASGAAWQDSYCDLPTEANLYGGFALSSSRDDFACGEQKFALFEKVRWEDVFPRMDVWLNGVCSSTLACNGHAGGFADSYDASRALFVCPFACIA